MLKRLPASNKRPYFKEAAQDYEFPEKRQGPTLNIFDKNLYNYQDAQYENGFPGSNKGANLGGNLHRTGIPKALFSTQIMLGQLSCSMGVNDTSQMNGALDCLTPEAMERLRVSRQLF